MARSLVALLLATSIAVTSGCAMCCAPNDCDYLYQGGAWVRHNPSAGRVGSAFDEAGGPAMLADASGASAAEDLPPAAGAPITSGTLAPGQAAPRGAVPRGSAPRGAMPRGATPGSSYLPPE